MPIVGYFEKQDEVYYTITEKDCPVEDIPAKQLIASRPLLIELFDYEHNIELEKRIISKVETSETFSKRMEMMIIDYLEAEHYEVGLQLIENLYGTGKKPPFGLLLALVNMILKSKDKIKKRQQLKQHWLFCKRAHSILIDILYLFGPSIYHPLWNQFKYFELVSNTKVVEDDDYELLNTNELKKYSDFWNFTDRLLNVESYDIDSKCRRLILDLFVNILKMDLKSRMKSEIKVGECIFIRTLKKDAICRISKFERYLNILLKCFPQKDEHELYLTSEIINMVITIACYDNISSIQDLINQTYRIFQQMNTNTSQEFLQIIQYPTFIIHLLDNAIADTNISLVSIEYQYYRHTKHISLDLKKVIYFVFKILPIQTTLESIHYHVSIISKYVLSILSTFNIKRQKKKKILLSEEQLELLIINQYPLTLEWENLIENLLSNLNIQSKDIQVIEKIRWIIKLTILTLTEFF